VRVCVGFASSLLSLSQRARGSLCHARSTFFKDFHAALVEVLHRALTPKGMVFMFNPARHGTLDRFADLTRQAGLETLVEFHYDDTVWARHQRLTQAAGTPDEVPPTDPHIDRRCSGRGASIHGGERAREGETRRGGMRAGQARCVVQR
jgi:hypothetical protein